eukprot:1254993-Rhodomonas_salina.3
MPVPVYSVRCEIKRIAANPLVSGTGKVFEDMNVEENRLRYAAKSIANSPSFSTVCTRDAAKSIAASPLLDVQYCDR